MSEEFLNGDASSRLVDGLPDLSKYLFIHSSIDEAGLDPYEFRIFCHLRRRAKDGKAYPGMRSISEITGIGVGKVCTVIRSLQNKGYLKVQSFGHSQANVYYVLLPAERCSQYEHGVPHMNTGVPNTNTGVPNTNERVSIEGNPFKEKPPNPLAGGNDVVSAAPKKKKKLTAQSVIEALPLDLTLQSLSFRSAWKRWVDARLALPRPVTLNAFRLHAIKCALLGERRAIAAIDHSIASSYVSIYELKVTNGFRNGKSETCL